MLMIDCWFRFLVQVLQFRSWYRVSAADLWFRSQSQIPQPFSCLLWSRCPPEERATWASLYDCVHGACAVSSAKLAVYTPGQRGGNSGQTARLQTVARLCVFRWSTKVTAGLFFSHEDCRGQESNNGFINHDDRSLNPCTVLLNVSFA
jgi:hypothetical protein